MRLEMQKCFKIGRLANKLLRRRRRRLDFFFLILLACVHFSVFIYFCCLIVVVLFVCILNIVTVKSVVVPMFHFQIFYILRVGNPWNYFKKNTEIIVACIEVLSFLKALPHCLNIILNLLPAELKLITTWFYLAKLYAPCTLLSTAHARSGL